MQKNLGIWVDHKKAVIVTLGEGLFRTGSLTRKVSADHYLRKGVASGQPLGVNNR